MESNTNWSVTSVELETPDAGEHESIEILEKKILNNIR